MSKLEQLCKRQIAVVLVFLLVLPLSACDISSSSSSNAAWLVLRMPSPPRGSSQYALPQAVTFSPDGQMVAAGSYLLPSGEGAWVWGINNASPSATPTPIALKGHTGYVNAVAFSPDGQTLASAGDDRTVRTWKFSDPTSPPLVLDAIARVETIAFNGKGMMLAAGRTDGRIDVWRYDSSGQIEATPFIIRVSSESVHSIAFSTDGRFLATASHDKSVYLWDALNLDSAPTKLTGHTEGVTSVAFSPDSKTLASGAFDNTVRLWNIDQPSSPPSTVGTCDSTANSVAFSPNGSYIAAGCQDNSVRIWSSQQPNPSPTILTGHTNLVNSVAFSPDGGLLASASDDETIRLWKVANQTPTATSSH